MNNRLFVQVTYKDLLQKFFLITLFKVNCEIYIPPGAVDLLEASLLAGITGALDKNKILRRIHAPVYNYYKEESALFMESYPKVRRFSQALGANAVVIHADEWRGCGMDLWKWLADSAERDGLEFLLENHNEQSAEEIVRILDTVGSGHLKACFDIGHFNVFGKKEASLFLDDYPEGSIREIHLSDNLGDGDTHLPLGKGNIDFPKFFEAIEKSLLDPVLCIEAKDVRGVLAGMNYLRKIGRF